RLIRTPGFGGNRRETGAPSGGAYTDPGGETDDDTAPTATRDGDPTSPGSLSHEDRLAELLSQLQLFRSLRPEQHAPRASPRLQRRHGAGRHRVPDPPASGHGDRDLGAGWRAGAQGLRGQLGHYLSGVSPAHERGHGHLALRDESTTRWRCPLRPDVGATGHGADSAGLRAARHQRPARPGRPRADRLRSWPFGRDLDPPTGRRTL